MTHLIMILPLISGICYRLGGVGRDDRFLPFMQPPTPIAWKGWRWLVLGSAIAIFEFNWIYIPTYFIATNVFVYGEKSWMAKLFGKYRWLVSGLAFGMASLNWGNGVFCAGLFLALKYFDIDQAYFEVLVGLLGTLIFVFN